MVNLDNVISIERELDKTRIYLSYTGESVVSELDYDTFHSIILSRNSRLNQPSSAVDSMARDLRQLAKFQTTPVP